MPDPITVDPTDTPAAEHSNRCFFIPLPSNHMWRSSESNLFVVGDSDIDLRTSDVYYKNLLSNVTFTFSNPPRRNITKKFTLIVNRESDYTVTWPSGITWTSGSEPTLVIGLNVFNFLMYNDTILATVVTDTSGAAAAVASQLQNAFTIKIKNGNTEGVSKYTFDGSAAKTLDIRQGSNVSISTNNGAITISATDTNTDTHYSSYLYAGSKNQKYNSSTNNGSTALVLVENNTVRSNIKLTGSNGVEVTSDASGEVTIKGSGSGGSECYPYSYDAIGSVIYSDDETAELVDKTIHTGKYGKLTIKFFDEDYYNEATYEKSDFNIYNNVDQELDGVLEALKEGFDQYSEYEFNFEDHTDITGISVSLEINDSNTGDDDVEYSCVGDLYPNCSSSVYSTWQYVQDNIWDGTEESITDSNLWNVINFDPNNYLHSPNTEMTIDLNFKPGASDSGGSDNGGSDGGGGDGNGPGILVDNVEFKLKITRDSSNKYHFYINYYPIISD